MVNMGSRGDVDVKRDHWTVVTKDGLPSVHMEHTFAITREGVVVVTADDDPAPIIRGGELVAAPAQTA
jgi:methionyl aminopeptidase